MITRLADRLHREDSGATAVLIALFIVLIVLPVSAISVDLSNGYANRRQTQNAADAAAQAGAQVMATGQRTMTINAAVQAIAQKNGVDTTDPGYSCEVVTVTYPGGVPSVANGAPCTSWTATGGYNAVRVKTAHNIQTFFAPALGLVDGSSGASITRADGLAVAAIQKVSNPLLGDAVFAMCSYDDATHPDTTRPPLLVPDGTGSYKLNLNTDASVAPAPAIGHRYVIWSNAGGNSNVSRCGLGGSSFDGRICGMVTPPCGQPIDLTQTPGPPRGGWLQINTGAAVGPTLATMAGYAACNPNNFTGTHVAFTPCAMALPVCSASNNSTGSNGQLFCNAFGEFLLSPGQQDSNDSSCTNIVGTSDTICGTFLGAPDLASGQVTSGPPGPNDGYRVALVQ